MPYRVLGVPQHGMLDALEAAQKARGFRVDGAQRAAAQSLQMLYDQLIAFKAARRSALRKLLARPQMPRGVYFWGGVGRGKSFLMDCFYEAVPYQRKRRVHFHAFMQEVHKDLRARKDQPDPLLQVAERIARQTRLLCFDEFHVADIADAMILGRLLDALLARGVILVMTSNYPPDGLYPNGLQRQNFLPTIDLLKRRLDVIEVDAGVDYRLRTLERIEVFLVPDDAAAERDLAEDFARVAGAPASAGVIEVLGRQLGHRGAVAGVIWFDFDVLCGGPRSQNDYLEIARQHHTVLLSHVPQMTPDQASEARRFTWLVDVFYDHHVKLLVSAACEAHELYVRGAQSNEFARTVSRLVEMRTREYLASAHRSD